MRFTWDPAKEATNQVAHGVDFTTAQLAFDDPYALVIFDEVHSDKRELRWWLLGKIEERVLLVRYTHRPTGLVRIIGAGYWRQGKEIYENYWKEK